MPRKLAKGGESRLGLEGLDGLEVGITRKRTIVSVRAHGQRRRTRTVTYDDGTQENRSIYNLVGLLIENR